MVPEWRPPAVPDLDRGRASEVGDAGGERSFPSVPGSLLISDVPGFTLGGQRPSPVG